MEAEIDAKLSQVFAELTDPRRDHTRRHLLIDIVVIAICAVIAGEDDFEAVAEFGVAREGWLRRFLALPNGIPSHDTFWRVFRALDAVQFERCFRLWVATVSELHPGEVIAIDGKVVRRSFETCPKQGPLQLVSAWATEHNVVPAQLRVDEKTNEIVAVPALLEQLDVIGCLVTADALNCQVKTAERILEKGGDYLLAIKGNQPGLYDDIVKLFVKLFDDLTASRYRAYAFRQDKSVASGHGRLETRHLWVMDDPEVLKLLPNYKRWPQLASVIRIRSERRITAGPLEKRGQSSTCTRYYISSATASASFFNQAVRKHWCIENAAHWVLDIAFREDDSRLRRDNGAENFATLRRIALSLLKQDTSSKLGVKNKRLKASWDHHYLVHLLTQPHGHMLLARADAGGERDFAGIACLRSLAPSVCEVKRMFVRPAYRGQGIGRTLLQALLDEARGDGFTSIRLDSAPFMLDAHALYRAFGFTGISPYPESEVPPQLHADWLFMARPLNSL